MRPDPLDSRFPWVWLLVLVVAVPLMVEVVPALFGALWWLQDWRQRRARYLTHEENHPSPRRQP